MASAYVAFFDPASGSITHTSTTCGTAGSETVTPEPTATRVPTIWTAKELLEIEEIWRP